MLLKHSLLCSFLFVIMQISAQKVPLSVNDFASWNRIEKRQISRNGNIIIYELNQQKGDGKLIIHNIKKQSNDTIPLGYSAIISSKTEFIAYKVKPATDTIRKAKLAKLKKEQLPTDSMGFFILNGSTKKTYPDVKSFKLPEENSSWVAMLLKHSEPEKDTTNIDTTLHADTLSSSIPKKEKAKDSNDLIILNPVTLKEFTFNRIEEYTVPKKGHTFSMLSKLSDTTKSVALITFNTLSLKTDTLFSDSLTFKKLCTDEEGKQIAFLASADTVDKKVYSLYHTHLDKPMVSVVVDTATKNMPKNWAVSEFAQPFFSQDGSKLFLGTANKPLHEPNDSILDEEIPKVDVWSWTDIELQPMQLVNLKKEQERTYRAVYHLNDKNFIQLGDTIIRDIRLTNKNNGNWAFGLNSLPYKRATSWNGKWFTDYYLINVNTGKKKQILKGKSEAYLSPQGKFTIWYENLDSSFYAINNKNGKVLSLTKNLPVAFCDELNDVPNDPYPYRVAGWAKNDAFVFIYDRYDIWKFDLSGKTKPINITNSYGRKNSISFKYQKLDNELVFIPSEEEIYLTGENEKTLNEGFYKTTLSEPNNPLEIINGTFKLNHLIKAKDNDRVIWAAQTTNKYPNIVTSSLLFSDSITISDANPQQKKFVWAVPEVVKWRSFSGDTLRGILYKPENFDSTQKYPMLVYFYERSIHTLHYYFTPSPSRSIINRTFYPSNGYLVFVPDIVYETGYPGQSAYNAIVSGTNYLTNTRNYIDENKIGLQGQSWGGYQTAYLITQTDMFAAAMAGAPVSNMTSAYGGIRWGSGMSRMFQYEHTQSRIGGSLWDKTMLYLENSPVFYAPKVNTPLLMMHNDNDGAVPWYQGIEYFVALRRLNKPVWLLNYNGMKHNIESKFWANRIDLSTRMFQFFNHYLKDEPAPDWMNNGVPAIHKGKNLGY